MSSGDAVTFPYVLGTITPGKEETLEASPKTNQKLLLPATKIQTTNLLRHNGLCTHR